MAEKAAAVRRFLFWLDWAVLRHRSRRFCDWLGQPDRGRGVGGWRWSSRTSSFVRDERF